MGNNHLTKIILAAAILALTQQAATASTVNFALEGTVASICTVSKSSTAAVHIIDLTNTGSQSLGQLTYVCNNPAGFTRTITSAEGGALKRIGGSQTIPYSVAHSVGKGVAFPATSLATPLITNVAGSTSLINGVTGSFSVILPTLPTNLYAGTYTDTVTITIVGN